MKLFIKSPEGVEGNLSPSRKCPIVIRRLVSKLLPQENSPLIHGECVTQSNDNSEQSSASSSGELEQRLNKATPVSKKQKLDYTSGLDNGKKEAINYPKSRTNYSDHIISSNTTHTPKCFKSELNYTFDSANKAMLGFAGKHITAAILEMMSELERYLDTGKTDDKAFLSLLSAGLVDKTLLIIFLPILYMTKLLTQCDFQVWFKGYIQELDDIFGNIEKMKPIGSRKAGTGLIGFVLNVIESEVFELALFVSNVQNRSLTFVPLHQPNSRFNILIPVYVDGYINRKTNRHPHM